MKPVQTACICCLIILILISQAVAYDNRPIIVLREDDGWTNLRNVFAEFDNKSFLQYAKDMQMPITWALITNRAALGGDAGLSWAEHIDYITGAGGELASHSANHMPMSSLQAYIDDVLQSKAAIQANTPYTCYTFLQPGTWTGDAYFTTLSQLDNSLGQAIENNFSQSQLYIGQLCIGPPVYQHGHYASFDIDYKFRPVPADFLRAIDYVSQTPGYIFVIQFHGMQSPTGSADYCTRSDLMAGILTKLAQLRDGGTIRLLSLNDAYNNNEFSTDVNRIFDSGFEFTKAELAKYITVWQLSTGATIVDQVGYNNSKCARIVPGGYVRQEFIVPSGRYKLTWMQEPDYGTPFDAGVSPKISPTNPWTDSVSNPKYLNSTNDWEQKSLFLRIPKTGKIRVDLSSTGAFLVDSISLQLANPTPANSVSDFALTPVPTGLFLSWRTPDDTSYNKVILRYSTSQQCPQTTSSGNLIQQITADNGNTQTIFYPCDWINKWYIYCSAFAVSDNTYSEPDVNYLAVDRSKPTVTISPVTEQNNVVYISWTSTASTSGIFTSYYAIGSMPNATDVIGWTEDTDGSVQLDNLQPGKEYYLGVKSQNLFGFWSDIASSSFVTQESTRRTSPKDMFAQQDGNSIVITGQVSAIFSDCYYIEFSNHIRGIKVVGSTSPPYLGATVTVQGTIKTASGERYIDVCNEGM